MGDLRELPGVAGGRDGRRLGGRAKAAENRHRVMTMLTAGASPEEVAKALGMKQSRVNTIIRAVLETWEVADFRAVEHVKEAQLRRIDRLVSALWPRALGMPERPDAPRRAPDLKAVAEIRQLEALRADIVGTKAAKKVEFGGTIGVHVDAEEVDRLEAAWLQSTAEDITEAAIVGELELEAGAGAE